MNNQPASQQASGGLNISPGDIVYTIFRHLKKIILFAILGVVSGAVIYKLWPDEYQSNAKLIIKFVAEDRGIVDAEQDTRVVSYGARGTGYIIAAEQAIVTSLDLARAVAEDIGPERIITDSETEPTINAAAGFIRKNLSVVNPKYTNMLAVSIKHPDPDLPTEILQSVIDNYFEMHLSLHRKSDAFEGFVTRETDQMRMRLQQTETEIQAQLEKADVISIGDAKQRISTDISSIRHRILETQSIIAELTSAAASLSSANDEDTDEEANENVLPRTASPSKELAAAISDYSAKQQNLELLRSRERTLRLQFTEENSRVKAVIKQIENVEQSLATLRQDYPELLAYDTPGEQSSEAAAGESLPSSNPRLDQIRIIANQARLKVLNDQLAQLKTEAKKIDSIEITVNELLRRKALQESKYRALLESMEKARVQEELGGGVNNIGIVESPSPAYRAQSKKLQFSAGAIVGIGIIGLAWALVCDILLDRSIKRPTEIQRSLGIPLFMSLPDLNDKKFLKANPRASRHQLQQAGKIKQLEAAKKSEYKPKSPTLQAAAISDPEQYGNGPLAQTETIGAWDEEHALSEHFEGLRDKVITYFESKNLTHKPKLIGMTGLGSGSGVTTIASGLAGSLSKIGEGSVLLVDMTLGQETAQQFYKGKSLLNLDEVLEASEEAKVENNLYVVAEGSNGTKLPRIMPQRFNKIMPKLRASDFDYIIFDLPPVSPISSTPRLASFMDTVLMVVESEKTNRDVANQAIELLADSKAHLGGILNKTKSRVPKKLEQDLLSQA